MKTVFAFMLMFPVVVSSVMCVTAVEGKFKNIASAEPKVYESNSVLYDCVTGNPSADDMNGTALMDGIAALASNPSSVGSFKFSVTSTDIIRESEYGT